MGSGRAALAVLFCAGASASAIRGADCNRNGTEDAADIVAGRSGDCNGNGVPDECDTFPAILELAPAIALEESPGALAAADLEGDGDADLAAMVAGGCITLLGDGRGGFRAWRRLALADDPTAMVVLDTNGDGLHDLVLADRLQDVRGRGTLSLLESDGAGGLRPARVIGAPPGPVGIATADLDGDGILDLALACRDASGVAILGSDGNGSYEERLFLETQGSPSAIAAGDLDGDGRIDIVAGDAAGALFIFRRPPERWGLSTLLPGSELREIVLADFDADGDSDLALAVPAMPGEESGLLGVLLNDGKGALMPSAPRGFPGSARALAAADLDGDGRADLVAADEPASSVLVRHGPIVEGASPAYGYATGPGPRQALPLDLDRDGAIDLCVAEAGGVSILINSGSGRLDAPLCLHVGEGAGGMTAIETRSGGGEVALDLDGDGRDDIALTHYRTTGGCSMIFGGAGGLPDETTSFATASDTVELAAADLDGDGLPDLALADLRGGISVHWNGGRRAFRPGPVLAAGGSSVAAADLDDDGDMDLASVGTKLHLWENAGDGAFTRRREVEVGRGATKLASADLDGDHDVDLAVAASRDSRISVVENLGGGAYAPARTVETEGSSRIAAADLDGDGAADLIADGRDNDLLLLWNDGNARFEPAVHPIADDDLQSISPADLDADGSLDLAVSGFEEGRIEILVNRGRRRFETMPALPPEGRVFAIGSADLDGDGRVEVLAARPGPGTLVAFRVLSASTADRNANRIPDACEGALFIRGDADGDGRIGISDAIFVLLHLFRGGAEPSCEASADLDGNGTVLLADPIGLLDYLFRGGPPPAPPFPDCDTSSPGEVLPCKEHEPCGG